MDDHIFICQFNVTFTEESQEAFWMAQMMETDEGGYKKAKDILQGHLEIRQGEMASNWKRIDLY